MNLFLRHFSYRTSRSIWVLVATGAVALLIALFTLAFQTVHAALSNPIKSLRTE